MLFALQYLTQLEIELQEFTTQNQKLKEENQALKQRLSVIQREVWSYNQILIQVIKIDIKVCLFIIKLFKKAVYMYFS